jgi:predicted DNA binding CopG/RHH family protein
VNRGARKFQTLSVRLDPTDVEDIRVRAGQQGLLPTQLIRKVMVAYLMSWEVRDAVADREI